MIRANIIDENLVFVPFDETLPFIEITEEEYQKIIDGKLKIVNGVLTDTTPMIKKQKRIAEIQTWFEEYDNQVKQYERCQRLGIEFDKDMVALDNQADAYQKELREIDYKKPSEYN